MEKDVTSEFIDFALKRVQHITTVPLSEYVVSRKCTDFNDVFNTVNAEEATNVYNVMNHNDGEFFIVRYETFKKDVE